MRYLSAAIRGSSAQKLAQLVLSLLVVAALIPGSALIGLTGTANAVVPPTYNMPPATVMLQPPFLSMPVGGNATMAVAVQAISNVAFDGSGGTAPAGLYGAEFHLKFDPTQVQVVDANANPADGVQISPAVFGLPEANYFVAQNNADNTLGTIDFVVILLNPQTPVTGGGLLANIQFHCIAAGVSPVNFFAPALPPVSLAGVANFGTTDDTVEIPPITPSFIEPQGQVPVNSLIAQGQQIQPRTLTVQTPSGQGRITPLPGTYVYPQGATVTLEAMSAPNWSFSAWTGPVATPGSPVSSVLMDTDKTVGATFVESGAQAGVPLALIQPMNNVSVNNIFSVTLNTTVLPGQPFDHVLAYIDFDPALLEVLDILPHAADAPAVTSSFDNTTGQITFESTAPASVNIFGPHSVGVINFRALAQTGASPTPITISTTSPRQSFVSNQATHLTGPKTDSAATISASGAQTYTLTMAVSGNGATSPSVGPHGSYAPGTIIRIAAAPSTGWNFLNWMGPVSRPDSQVASIQLNSDTTVTANFTQSNTHTLTLNVSGPGSTMPNIGPHTRIEGSVVTLTATPFDGAVFTGWSGPVDSPSSPVTTVVMDTDKTVTANFQQGSGEMYSLTIAIIGSGSVMPVVGVHSYPVGSVIGIGAMQSPGWSFSGWTGDPVSNAFASHTAVTMDSDKSITANFVEGYTLNVSVAPPGAGVTTPSVGSYPGLAAGSNQSLNATPNTGYTFVNWSGPVANPGNASTNVTMNSDIWVTANFTQGAGTDVPLSLQPGSNSVPMDGTFVLHVVTNVAADQPVSAVDAYINFDPVYLEVVDSGPAVAGIQIVAGTSLPNVIQNTVDNALGRIDFSSNKSGAPFPVGNFNVADITFHAKAITAAAPTPILIHKVAPRQSQVLYNAIVLNGAHSDSSANIGGQAQNYTMTMAVSPVGGGTTTPAVGPNGPYAPNTVVNISATPAVGYTFVNWSGPVANPNNPSTTVNVNGNFTVTANFSQSQAQTYTLTMAVSPVGAGVVTPSAGDHSGNGAGSSVNISATPNTGYSFVNWTTNVTGSVANVNAASTNVTMNANTTVTANFTQLADAPLSLSPTGNNVLVGQTFDVTISTNAAAGVQISAADVFLDFDPTKLQVLSVTMAATSPLNVDLTTDPPGYFDNTVGQVNYSAGKLTGTPPTGSFPLAVVSFQAIASTTSPTPITFALETPRRSLVAYSGNPVLGTHVNASASIVYDIPLSLLPATNTVTIGQVFPVTISTNAPANMQIDSVQAYVNYDPSLLEVVDDDPISAGVQITSGLTLPIVNANSANNATGQLDFTATASASGVPAGAFEVGTINFRAKAESAGTPLNLSMEGGRTSSVTFLSAIVPGGHANSSAVIVFDTPLRLVASGPKAYVDTNFTVTIETNVAAGTQIAAVDAFVNFDPAKLQVVSVAMAPTSPLNVDLTTDPPGYFDNTTGQVNYSAGKLTGTPASGSFPVAVITFTAIAETTGTNTTPITFSLETPRRSLVAFSGNPVPGTHVDTAVDIDPGATIYGHLTLQGGSRPAAARVVALTVKLFPAGQYAGTTILTATPAMTYTPSTVDSANGNNVTFQIDGVVAGTYDILVVSPHTLHTVKRGVVVGPPSVDVYFSNMLEGNANDDTIINALDFSILAATYGKLSGQAGWDARADFDRTGAVNALDFSLLAANYMKTSPQLAP